MNIKYLIFGIFFLFWNKRNSLYNENDDDGSIESGFQQWGRKHDDIRGYMSAIGFIILGIISIYKGIIGE